MDAADFNEGGKYREYILRIIQTADEQKMTWMQVVTLAFTVGYDLGQEGK